MSIKPANQQTIEFNLEAGERRDFTYSGSFFHVQQSAAPLLVGFGSEGASIMRAGQQRAWPCNQGFDKFSVTNESSQAVQVFVTLGYGHFEDNGKRPVSGLNYGTFALAVDSPMRIASYDEGRTNLRILKEGTQTLYFGQSSAQCAAQSAIGMTPDENIREFQGYNGELWVKSDMAAVLHIEEMGEK